MAAKCYYSTCVLLSAAAAAFKQQNAADAFPALVCSYRGCTSQMRTCCINNFYVVLLFIVHTINIRSVHQMQLKYNRMLAPQLEAFGAFHQLAYTGLNKCNWKQHQDKMVKQAYKNENLFCTCLQDTFLQHQPHLTTAHNMRCL